MTKDEQNRAEIIGMLVRLRERNKNLMPVEGHPHDSTILTTAIEYLSIASFKSERPLQIDAVVTPSPEFCEQINKAIHLLTAVSQCGDPERLAQEIKEHPDNYILRLR